MEEKYIDRIIAKQLEVLFNFTNSEIEIFINSLKVLNIEKKKELIFDLDKKLKENNNLFLELKTKLKIKENQIEEYLEKNDLNIEL